MKITKQQIKTLLDAVAKTSNLEISCQTCEDQLAEFAESQLVGKGTPAALKAIEEHLEICPECREELGFIQRALDSADLSDSSS